MTSKEKARARALWAAFRLTPEDWNKILAYQNGVCFICGKSSEGKRLSTDHSHDSGVIRGLLCARCNPLLGKLENAFKRYGLHKVDGVTLIGILIRMLMYLKSPPATEALGRQVVGFPGKIGTERYRKWVKNNPTH